MRDFGFVPIGLGVCATVLVLEIADALAWRVDPVRREPLFGLAASLSLLAWASLILLKVAGFASVA